jgi:hypothetical protein
MGTHDLYFFLSGSSNSISAVDAILRMSFGTLQHISQKQETSSGRTSAFLISTQLLLLLAFF